VQAQSVAGTASGSGAGAEKLDEQEAEALSVKELQATIDT